MSSITPQLVRQTIDDIESAICNAWEAGNLLETYKGHKKALKWIYEQRVLDHAPAVKAEFEKNRFLWRLLVLYRNFRDGKLTAGEFNSAVTEGMRSRESEVADATARGPTANPPAQPRIADPKPSAKPRTATPHPPAKTPTAEQPKARKRVQLPSEDREAVEVEEAPKVRQKAKRVTRATGMGDETDVETGYETEGGGRRAAVIGTGIFHDPKCGRCEDKGVPCEVRGRVGRRAGATCTRCAQLKVRCTLAPEKGDGPKKKGVGRKSKVAKKTADAKAEGDTKMADARPSSIAEGSSGPNERHIEQAPGETSMAGPTRSKVAEGKRKEKAQKRGPSADAGPSFHAGAIAGVPHARIIADGTPVENGDTTMADVQLPPASMAAGQRKGKARDRGRSAEAGPSTTVGNAGNTGAIADVISIGSSIDVGNTGPTADVISIGSSSSIDSTPDPNPAGTSSNNIPVVGNLTSATRDVIDILIEKVLLLEEKVAEYEARDAEHTSRCDLWHEAYSGSVDHLEGRIQIIEENIRTVWSYGKDTADKVMALMLGLGSELDRRAGHDIPEAAPDIELEPPNPKTSQELAEDAHAEFIPANSGEASSSALALMIGLEMGRHCRAGHNAPDAGHDELIPANSGEASSSDIDVPMDISPVPSPITLPAVRPGEHPVDPLPELENSLPALENPLPAPENPLPARENSLPALENPLPALETSHSALETSPPAVQARSSTVDMPLPTPVLLQVAAPAIRRSPRLSPSPDPLPILPNRRLRSPGPSSKRAGSILEEGSAMKRSRHE